MLRLRDKQTRDRRDVKGSMEKLIKLAISEIYRVITLWRGGEGALGLGLELEMELRFNRN